MPWVHIDDVVGIMMLAARSTALDGPLNAVGPDPVRNVDFTRALARAVRRPAVFPVPRAALSLLFGEMSGIVLASQRALPRAAERAGYAFAYGDLDGALRACV